MAYHCAVNSQYPLVSHLTLKIGFKKKIIRAAKLLVKKETGLSRNTEILVKKIKLVSWLSICKRVKRDRLTHTQKGRDKAPAPDPRLSLCVCLSCSNLCKH